MIVHLAAASEEEGPATTILEDPEGPAGGDSLIFTVKLMQIVGNQIDSQAVAGKTKYKQYPKFKVLNARKETFNMSYVAVDKNDPYPHTPLT